MFLHMPLKLPEKEREREREMMMMISVHKNIMFSADVSVKN